MAATAVAATVLVPTGVALRVDNLFDRHYVSEAQTNSDVNNFTPPGAAQSVEVRALEREPSAAA